MLNQELAVPAIPEGTATCLDKFLDAIYDLLSKRVDYDFVSTRKSSAIPTHVACVVTCTDDCDRCLAFAVRDRGRVKWFGVIGEHQEPMQLREVRGYVEVDDGLRNMVLGVSKF